jgi:hypothetical protein
MHKQLSHPEQVTDPELCETLTNNWVVHKQLSCP